MVACRSFVPQDDRMEGTIVCVVKNTPSGGHPSGRGELDTAKKKWFHNDVAPFCHSDDRKNQFPIVIPMGPYKLGKVKFLRLQILRASG
jgi:hypothetical protein